MTEFDLQMYYKRDEVPCGLKREVILMNKLCIFLVNLCDEKLGKSSTLMSATLNSLRRIIYKLLLRFLLRNKMKHTPVSLLHNSP